MTFDRPCKSNSLVQEASFDRWHNLFDALCDARGYSDTGKLASRVCRESGKRGRAHIEAATRNINNWRNGNHLPSRGNFGNLTKILEIDSDENIRNIWNRLYQDSNKQRNRREKGHPAENSRCSSNNFSIKFGDLANSSFVAGSLLTVLIFGVLFWVADRSVDEPTLEDWHRNYIEYREEVSLRVGNQTVIHGYRAKCRGLPPSVEMTEFEFPRAIRTGKLVAGALGLRDSDYCGELTPAREVIFLATMPGTEDFMLFGDHVTVTVVE